MKSKLLFAGLITLGLTSKAQFGEKGQRLIGGTFGISHLSNKTPFGQGVESTSVNLSVSRGVFRKPNVLTNYFIYFGFNNIENRGNLGTIVTSGGNQGGVGYGQTWFKPLGKNFFFGLNATANAGLDYLQQDNGNGSPKKTDRGFAISASIVPVLSYQLSNRFVANINPSNNFLSLDYSYAKSKLGDITSSTIQRIGLNTGFWNSPLQNINIGFSYLLKRK
jgi:hypothetical protein